ncbi:MAG: alpha/beta hydrolase [Gemmataceae bacterium]
MHSFRRAAALGACGLLMLLTFVRADEGQILRITVRGRSLEKNPAGEAADRRVTVYLPPGYEKSAKRYPVLYLLHGIGDTDEIWTDRPQPYANIKDLMDRGIAERRFGEMIVVMPDERTRFFGSFYTNSAWTGNWEDFTAKDLVAEIDAKYRTLARNSARGIAGHSMGGHGAIKLGMKHPDVFSVVYGLNPALLGWGADLSPENPAFTAVLKLTTREQLLEAGVYPAGVVCVAQAFSPNPDAGPFHIDLPYALVNGKMQPAEPGFGRWEANMPVTMVKQYAANLRKLRSLRFDSGWDDEFTHIVLTSRQLSRTLMSYGIDHIFEEYNGDHRNRLPGRTGRLYAAVLPYFGLLLDGAEAK